MEEALVKLLGYLAGGSIGIAVIVGITWLAFKKFSESWLDSKFAKDLEEAKQEHQKELQRIQLQIDARLDRAAKLHSKEFEVLHEAWRLIDLATAATNSLTGKLVSIPPLNTINNALVDLTLKSSGLSEVVQEQIRQATDKEKLWGDARQSQDLDTANRLRVEFFNYFMANGIWIKRDLRAQFVNLHDLVLPAWIERHSAFSMRGIAGGASISMKASSELNAKAPAMLQKLQDDISTRLWRSEVELQ